MTTHAYAIEVLREAERRAERRERRASERAANPGEWRDPDMWRRFAETDRRELAAIRAAIAVLEAQEVERG